MDVRQVEYALAVADEGSFTKAAVAQFVSQPALSQGVRALEKELGVELFHRLGRRVALTTAGEAFLGPARQLLRDRETLRQAVAAVRGLHAGRLDVVALPTLAVDPLAPLVGAFRTAYPQITVRLAEPEDAAAAIELVRQGACEVGLVAAPVPPDLDAPASFDQEILAVCPPGTALDRGGRLPVGRLATMPLVTAPVGTSTRRLLDDALADAAIVPTVAVETGQREALIPLVLAGAGTSFLPPALAHAAAEQGAVVARLRPVLRRRIALVHRHGPLSPAAAAFIAIAIPRLPL
jgi:LysR family carnitine catabolism transcriptional activator